MNRYQKTAVQTAFTLSFVLLSFAQQAHAVEYGGLGGRPAYPRADNERTESIFVHTVQPGEVVTDGVLLLNNTEEEKTLYVYAVDSAHSSDSAFACAQKTDTATGAGGWIILEEEEVVLQPNEQRIVPFTITVPESVDVGEVNACIAMQEKNTSAEQQAGVNLRFRTAIRVALTIPGDIVRELSLRPLEHAVTDAGVHRITIRAQNTGNVSIDASLHTQVKSVFGGVTVEQKGQFPVLRGEEAQWHVELPQHMWGGVYRATTELTYDPHEESGIGVLSGQGTTTLSASTAWFIVWPSLAVGFGYGVSVVVLVGACVYVYIRRRRHQAMRASWVEHVVRTGDTLHTLAEATHVSWKDLVRINRLRPPYALHEGDRIALPVQVAQSSKISDTVAQDEGDEDQRHEPVPTEQKPRKRRTATTKKRTKKVA